MHKKDVNDYLTEGLYGTRMPKDDERKKYLGTLRERIVLALTISQVMTDKGIAHLEQAMKEHPKTKLLMNGKVDIRFLKEEKRLANKYNIPYTIIQNEESDTNIGAVLTYDYAIDKENIFIPEDNGTEKKEEEQNDDNFLKRLKKWFS
mgnify:FL=1